LAFLPLVLPSLRLLAIFMPFFLAGFNVVGQSRLSIPVKISVVSGDVDGVTVYLNNNTSGEITETPGKSKMNLELILNNDYVITFSKKEYITKRIAINTSMPSQRLAQELYPFNFEVVLFPQYEGVNIVVFNQPVAKIFFDPLLDDFDYDTDYTKQIQSALKKAEEQIIAKQKEEGSKGGTKKRSDTVASNDKGMDSTSKIDPTGSKNEVSSLPVDTLPSSLSKQTQDDTPSKSNVLNGTPGGDQKTSNSDFGMDHQTTILNPGSGDDMPDVVSSESGSDPIVASATEARGGDGTSSINAQLGSDSGRTMTDSDSGSDKASKNISADSGSDAYITASPMIGQKGMEQNPDAVVSNNTRTVDEGFSIIKVDEYTESGKNILNVTVSSNGVEEVFRKVRFHWGGVYYYKSNDFISQAYFFAVTGYR
jgi:hypothetical protein